MRQIETARGQRSDEAKRRKGETANRNRLPFASMRAISLTHSPFRHVAVSILIVTILAVLVPTPVPGLEPITHGSRKRPLVALTFDDGPQPESTTRLLALLDTLQIKATFFLIGVEAVQNPDLVEQMLKRGHEVANHTYSHQRLDAISDQQIELEISGGQQVLEPLSGGPVRYFRPPGGRYHLGVLETLEKLKQKPVHWTVNAGDVDIKSENAALACKRLVKRIQAGDIVLLHNAPPATLAMLPTLVEGLHQKGLQCVTVAELLR